MNLWVTGYRSYELNVWSPKDKKITVLKAILTNILKENLDNGMQWVITGGQSGIEQWTIEAAGALKPEYPELKVAMMTPFADFASNWKEENQLAFAKRKQQVDFFASVSKQPYQSPAQLKNYQTFMLNHTDKAVMIYDPQYPGTPKFAYTAAKKYAEKNAYSLQTYDMDALQWAADDLASQNNWEQS